jgi:hypothetical protein
MDTPDEDRQDRRLRAALEPAPEAVERIIGKALSARPPGHPARPARPAGRLLPAGLAAAALLALMVLFMASPRSPGPPGPGRPAAPAGVVAIENVGDVIVVRPRAGGRWLIHNGETGRGSQRSGSVIFIHGGKR